MLFISVFIMYKSTSRWTKHLLEYWLNCVSKNMAYNFYRVVSKKKCLDGFFKPVYIEVTHYQLILANVKKLRDYESLP